MNTLAGITNSIGDQSQPLMTYYDMATGERLELSATTTANWVAKTANFLVDEAEAELGTRIRITARSHWQTYIWILAAWDVGCVITDGEADISLVGPDLIGSEREPVRVALSFRPLAARFAAPPADHIDYNAEVLSHSDYFVSLDPPTPDSPATAIHGLIATHHEVLAAVRRDAERRLVVPQNLATDINLLTSAIVGGGSLVLVEGTSGDQRQSIAESEHARI